jgi:hypothetical protein
MELFKFFKNENLKLALYHRMQGQYRTAFSFLKRACDEDNDPEALFLMGRTYQVGGFGKSPDPALSREYYRLSAKAECVWAKVVLRIPTDSLDSFSDFLKTRKTVYLNKTIEEGNVIGYSYFSFAVDNDFGRKIKEPCCMPQGNEGFKQKYGIDLSRHSYKFKNNDILKYAYMQLKGLGFEAFDPINTETISHDCVQHIYGYWLQKNSRYMWFPWQKNESDRIARGCLEFYRENIKRILPSILCAIWCLRQLTHKDVVLIIIQKVWKTRKYYLDWNFK